jgi:hypothetical protein
MQNEGRTRSAHFTTFPDSLLDVEVEIKVID